VISHVLKVEYLDIFMTHTLIYCSAMNQSQDKQLLVTCTSRILYDKKHCVIHYRYLQAARLSAGLRIVQIHHVLQFARFSWSRCDCVHCVIPEWSQRMVSKGIYIQVNKQFSECSTKLRRVCVMRQPEFPVTDTQFSRTKKNKTSNRPVIKTSAVS